MKGKGYDTARQRSMEENDYMCSRHLRSCIAWTVIEDDDDDYEHDEDNFDVEDGDDNAGDDDNDDALVFVEL